MPGWGKDWIIAVGAALLVHVLALGAWYWMPASEPQAGAGGVRVALAPAVAPVDDRAETQPQAEPEPALPVEEPVPVPPEEPEIETPPEEIPQPAPPVERQEQRAAAAPSAPTAPSNTVSEQLSRATGSASALIGAGDAEAEASYLAELTDWLARHKRYPRAARRRNLQGVAELSFTVTRSGDVTAYEITGSSGYAILDREVTAMLERAQPLPVFPAGLRRASLEIVIPVRFELTAD